MKDIKLILTGVIAVLLLVVVVELGMIVSSLGDTLDVDGRVEVINGYNPLEVVVKQP